MAFMNIDTLYLMDTDHAYNIIHFDDKYYILEWSRFNIKRLFHRHTAGDFYHININDTLEDKVIECLKNYGKIYDIKLVGD